MTPPNLKKSRAPTFSHLNPHEGKCIFLRIIGALILDAARKRKKQWLATQKIKAAYRAEKRRMGLTRAPASPGTGETHGSAETEGEPAKADSTDEEHSDRLSVEADAGPQPHAAAIAREARLSEHSQKNEKTTASAQPTPSLREMARDAYSPASLHTYKSNPLGRRPQGKRLQSNNGPHHTRDTKHGAAANGPARSRGQPNMAKRMGVLLEKIKRSNA